MMSSIKRKTKLKPSSISPIPHHAQHKNWFNQPNHGRVPGMHSPTQTEMQSTRKCWMHSRVIRHDACAFVSVCLRVHNTKRIYTSEPAGHISPPAQSLQIILYDEKWEKGGGRCTDIFTHNKGTYGSISLAIVPVWLDIQGLCPVPENNMPVTRM